MKPTAFEKIVIISSLVIGFLGAVIMVYFKMPSIISSVFLATGIATLVYYFLGGISDSSFDMGPVRLGGSIAALIASAWIINLELKDQITTSETVLQLNVNHEILNEHTTVLGKLNFKTLHLGKGEDELKVILNDSIDLGKLNLGSLHLADKFGIRTSDEITMGSINPKDFIDNGLYNTSTLKNYTEVKYAMNVRGFFEAKLDNQHWESPNRDFRNNYLELPFRVKPVFVSGMSDMTQVTTPEDLTIFNSKLDNKLEFPLIIDSEKSTIYYIRVANLKRNDPTDTFKNFVVYQIFGFNKSLS